MNHQTTPFPEQISDEAAFALSEALHWLVLVCDEKYFGQIRRHMATLNEDRLVDPQQPWTRKPST